MARVLTGVKPESRFDVVVLGGDGNVADQFTAVWKTPNSKQRLSVQQRRAALLELGNADFVKDKTVDAMVDLYSSRTADIDFLIKGALITVDDPDYEPSDLDEMLQHDNYRYALLASLHAVALGYVPKNAVPPGTSGQQDASPAEVAN